MCNNCIKKQSMCVAKFIFNTESLGQIRSLSDTNPVSSCVCTHTYAVDLLVMRELFTPSLFFRL